MTGITNAAQNFALTFSLGCYCASAGYETARCLCLVGAKVVVTCRSQSKIDETVNKLKEAVPSADVSGIVMELSSLKSVKSAAEEYKKSGKPLNILISNAGVMACPKALSEDGLEMQVRSS
jgi:NAD(P)-dependent dehydrogenase (short-subunit alcohol dehydrogenase family)